MDDIFNMTAEKAPPIEFPPEPFLLKPPRLPAPGECCGTGCIPCVMDLYEDELYEYQKALRAWQKMHPAAEINEALQKPNDIGLT